MTDFLASLEKTLPVLIGIFVSVFILILLTRLIFTLLIHFAKKHFSLNSDNEKKKENPQNFIKEDEELLRKLEKFPRQQAAAKAPATASNSYEIIPSEERQQEVSEMNKVNIVDIVKPIGFWTSMILGEKLTYLIQSARIINEQDNKGFWVSMIEAQERAQGRERGRMR